ncbi:MAG TPA: hypothetical protein VK358_09200 [Longimicrobium sp.]|nr:hypothetical protein [Longimicrobium sp.]
MPRTFPLLTVFAALLLSGGCIPYATGTTAATVAPGEVEPGTAVYFVPGGIETLTADSSGGSLIGFDVEARMGLDERSDLGIRLPGAVGAVLDYKRRVTGLEDPDGPGLALLVGGGVVNGGEHAIAMGGFVASGRRTDRATPYGGFKAMQVFPLTEEAVEDDPTIGFFAGLRIGTQGLGVSPEIAVFYDRSALGLRDNDVILVPSLTVHGDQLLDALLGRRPPTYPRPPRGPWR